MNQRTSADVIASLPPQDAKIIRELLIGLEAKNRQFKAWVADCQSGMYVNCVYCGHRYGPREDTPMAMADVLKAHIEQCPEHPLSKARARITELEAALPDPVKLRLLSGVLHCDAMRKAFPDWNWESTEVQDDIVGWIEAIEATKPGV